MSADQKKTVLAHGEIVYPAFFPDGTRGVVRCVDSADLEACSVPGLVMNTYHLSTKPGAGTLKACGGLHKFISWNRPILTDSGGFQVFSLIGENPKYGEIRPDGIIFKPENGDKILLTPEKCIDTQLACGSDIMMCLDWCTGTESDYETNRKSIDITVKWAARCKKELESRVASLGKKKIPPKLFAIIQGGSFPDLRRECAERLIELGFEGFGFGGWPLNADGTLASEQLALTAELMPDTSVKYAMGVGKPEEIVACRKMGYDLFDCVIPTREARHNRLFLFNPGYSSPEDIDLDSPDFYSYYYPADESHWRDSEPVSRICDCPCCRRFSRAYLRHLFAINEPLATRLATQHNLRFYSMLMETIAKRESN